MASSSMMFSTVDISGALAGAQAHQISQYRKTLLANTPTKVPEAEQKKLMTKAKEFESFYLYQVLELMAPKTDSEFDGGIGEEMFRHNLNEQMAKNLSNTNTMGISNAIYAELIKHQEALTTAREAAANPEIAK